MSNYRLHTVTKQLRMGGSGGGLHNSHNYMGVKLGLVTLRNEYWRVSLRQDRYNVTGEDCTVRIIKSALLAKCYSSHQIKNNMVDRTCGSYERQERVLVKKPDGQKPLGKPRDRCMQGT